MFLGMGPSPRCSPALGSDPLLSVQLARYLNRNYWEKKQEEARKSPTPSAPAPLAEPAALPGEGHAAPSNTVENPLPETESQLLTPSGGPFGEVSWAPFTRLGGEQRSWHAECQAPPRHLC